MLVLPETLRRVTKSTVSISSVLSLLMLRPYLISRLRATYEQLAQPSGSYQCRQEVNSFFLSLPTVISIRHTIAASNVFGQRLHAC
jgi:hypothetical protein